MTETVNNIELEYRALVSQAKYQQLLEFLNTHAKDLGEDDKNVFFFILPDKLLKVVDNRSKQSAKIVLKLNKIGVGSDFEELEIPIRTNEVEKAVHMFITLGFTEVQESFQQRHNFEFKGVELAIKYSDNWSYHVELEILLPDRTRQAEAEQRIRAVAKELDLTIMTDDELKKFTTKIDAEQRTRHAKVA